MEKTTPTKRYALLAAPLLVPLTTYAIFRAPLNNVNPQMLSMLGQSFYWLFWCLLFPVWIVGPQGLSRVFRAVPHPWGKPGWLGAVLLTLPVLLALLPLLPGVGMMLLETNAMKTNALPQSPLLIGVIVILVSVWNGILEEVLWRGAFISVFPNQRFLGYLYPAVGFGLWHLAPYGAQAGFGSNVAVIAAGGGVIFGLCWGWVAWKTGSIRMAALSHILSNVVLIIALFIR